MSESFSGKLRQLRLKNNWTLDQLAQVIGSSKAYVWQLENKKNARPSADLVFKIADTFDVAPEYFDNASGVELSAAQEESELVRGFRKLRERDRNIVLSILKSFERIG